MRSLKIGYVLKSFPVLSQVTVLNELMALREMGVQTTVISLLPPEEKIRHAIVEELWEQVIYLWEARRNRAIVLKSNLNTMLRSGWRRYEYARQLVEEIGLLRGARAFARLVDVAFQLQARGVRHLHAHFATEATSVAQALSLLSGLPFSFTAHAYDIFLDPHRLGEKMRAARFVVTVSEYNKRYLLEHRPDVPADKIHVVRPGVDLDRFSPDLRTPAEDGRFHIFCVGRLVEKKGYADLVEACRILRDQGVDFECTIVGEGPQRAALETTIARHGLKSHVSLAGAMSQEQFTPLLHRADVFVLPCVIAQNGDRDAMPLAIEEAMAMGLPVVSTHILGIPELVRDGAGILVPERDSQAVAQALLQLYRLPAEERMAMGRKGRAVVESAFSLQGETRRLVNLFKRSVEED